VQAPRYDHLDTLYIFGDRIDRRFTLKDGLQNIARVIEYTISTGIWDEYLTKLGGCEKFPSDDGLDKADSEERKTRAANLAKANMYMYNNGAASAAFFAEKMPGHYLEAEMPGMNPKAEIPPDYALPVLLCKEMDESIDAVINAGHQTGKLNWEQVWLIDDPDKIAVLSAEVCEGIKKVKEADKKVLEIINKAIKIIDNTISF